MSKARPRLPDGMTTMSHARRRRADSARQRLQPTWGRQLRHHSVLHTSAQTRGPLAGPVAPLEIGVAGHSDGPKSLLSLKGAGRGNCPVASKWFNSALQITSDFFAAYLRRDKTVLPRFSEDGPAQRLRKARRRSARDLLTTSTVSPARSKPWGQPGCTWSSAEVPAAASRRA